MSNHCSLHIDTECEPDVLCPGIFNRTIDYFNSSDLLQCYSYILEGLNFVESRKYLCYSCNKYWTEKEILKGKS